MRMEIEDKIIFARTAPNHPWPEYAAKGRGYYGRLDGGGLEGDDGLNDFKIAGQRLMALADAEEAKEKALLEAAGIDTSKMSVKDFVAKFNELRMGAKQFKAAVDRLNAALSRKDKAARAPTIAVWFTSKLGTELSRRINEFVNVNSLALSSHDFSAWDAGFDKMVDSAISAAFRSLLTQTKSKLGNELYGDKSTWREVYEASRQIKDFDRMFGSFLKSKIDFGKIKNIFEQNDVQIKMGKRNSGIRKFIDSKYGLNLGNGRRSRSLGGSVDEAVGIILNQMGLGDIHGTITTAGTTVMMNEVAKIDTVGIYSFDRPVDVGTTADDLLRELNEETEGSTSLEDMRRRLNDFYNSRLSQLTGNNFIVYGSGKAYSLSESFRGFSGGGSMPLSAAPGLIGASGGNAGAAEQVVKAAYETAAGAFRAGDGGPSESLKAGLMGAVAHMLFDDWNTIGGGADFSPSSGIKAIHTLRLEGVELPLSVFLRGAGQAMYTASVDMKRWIKVDVKIGAADTGIRSASNIDEMYNHWREEFSAVEGASNFTYHFMVNFKQIIGQFI